MRRVNIAFDCSGTLIGIDGKPRHEVIDLFRSLQEFGFEMYIWSGDGVDYANSVKERLGLKATVVAKGSFIPDVAVDDIMDASLGTVTLPVPHLSH